MNPYPVRDKKTLAIYWTGFAVLLLYCVGANYFPDTPVQWSFTWIYPFFLAVVALYGVSKFDRFDTFDRIFKEYADYATGLVFGVLGAFIWYDLADMELSNFAIYAASYLLVFGLGRYIDVFNMPKETSGEG